MATYQFTPGQIAFINEFSAKSGLDKHVVAAWVYSEQNGSAAQSYERGDIGRGVTIPGGFHDWLNIGRTDSGDYGVQNPFWRDPVSAADASVGWMNGTFSVPGFGSSAPSIRAIGRTANMNPFAQLDAIVHSGWASSGYPTLSGIYQDLLGNKLKSGKKIPGKPQESGGLGSAGDWIAKNILPWIENPLIPGSKTASLVPSGVGSAVGKAVLSPFGDIGKYVIFAMAILGGGLLTMLSLAMIAADIGIEQIREPRPVRGVRRGLTRARVVRPASTESTRESAEEARTRRTGAETRRAEIHVARVKTEQARATELRSRSRARNKQIRITKEEREKIKRQGYMEGFADSEHHREG